MIQIKSLPLGGPIDDFLNVVAEIYRDDPAYIRVPDSALRQRLDPKKSPFFAHADGAIFCAYRSGRCVGRITAQVDRMHLARHRDDTGFFGFFDTVDDADVARELLEAAADWLRDRGMKRILGPMSLSINEEMGCLVEGFDTPPYVLMPHHRPYQAQLIEEAGYTKAKDVYAWQYITPEVVPPRVLRAKESIRSLPEVTVRSFTAHSIREDVRLMFEVLDDAFSDAWGVVPMTPLEVENSARFFRSILVAPLSCLVSIDGEPAAVGLAIPNLNECVRDLNGNLSVIGMLKFLWRLKWQGTKSVRLPLLGIRKKWRGVRKYAGLSGFLYATFLEAGRRAGVKEWEFGWTLEENGPVHAGIRLMGGRRYKTFRVFDKPLVSSASPLDQVHPATARDDAEAP